MEGFSFVMPVTGLSRPNTGKVEDDDDDEKDSTLPLLDYQLTSFPILFLVIY
jgi:hypothetical protein